MPSDTVLALVSLREADLLFRKIWLSIGNS